MDLKESARQYVLSSLPIDPADTELVEYLNNLDARGLLIVYRNWMSRNVAPRPRAVQISATLQGKLPTSPHRPAVEAIIQDIEKGELLKKYLSKGAAIAAQIPRDDTKFQKRRDLDLMLTSWHMHHLHLGRSLGADGFVTRTGDLLFAIFRPNTAYLVDIMPHGSWSSDRLLEIAVDELPAAQAATVVRGVAGLARQDTEAQAQQLRNAAVNTARQIGNRVIMPMGFMSTAGTSFDASRAADEAIRNLDAFEKNWARDPDAIREACREGGGELDHDPNFVFHIMDNFGAGVLDLRSKNFIPFEAFG